MSRACTTSTKRPSRRPDCEIAVLRNTSEAFRERYLNIVRETARPHLWPVQRDRLTVLPSTLGELSQAIGAALVALYRNRR